MRKLFLISVMVCILLTACGEQKSIPTALPSVTPKLSFTATFPATSTSTKVPPTKQTPPPSVTPLPYYPNKQIIFDYYLIGDHSVYDVFFDPSSFRPYSRLVLYDDGLMIIPSEGESGGTYRQKILSPNEIKRFLSKLEALGFYSLESNQKHNPTNKLYNYGNDYQESFDGRSYCILVKTDQSRELCVYEPDLEYLIPKMKNILQFLGEYEPAGMTPYYPDRILLWKQAGRNPYDDHLPTAATPWNEHFPSLETPKPILYVDGDMAKEIYMLFDSTDAGKVFTQNGKEYTVYINVILPHEKVTNAYR